jgi:hypothetical protein
MQTRTQDRAESLRHAREGIKRCTLDWQEAKAYGRRAEQEHAERCVRAYRADVRRLARASACLLLIGALTGCASVRLPAPMTERMTAREGKGESAWQAHPVYAFGEWVGYSSATYIATHWLYHHVWEPAFEPQEGGR